MDIKTRFVSKEEVEQYTGLNLDNLLYDHNADRFIMRVEDDLDIYLHSRIGKNVNWLLPHLSNYQKELFKKACICQVEYIFRNGDISNDSGYNPESGKVADQRYLDSIAIGPKTKRYLQQAGIWTLKLSGMNIAPFNIFPGNFGL